MQNRKTCSDNIACNIAFDLIKKSRQKAIEIEIAIFLFLWESQGSLIGSFLSCFSYPSELLLQTDTYIDELVEIFLKLSMKTVHVHLIIGTILEDYDTWLHLKYKADI